MKYYREDINEKIKRISSEDDFTVGEEYLWGDTENTVEYINRLQDKRRGDILNIVLKAFLEHLMEVEHPCDTWTEDIPYYFEIRAAFTLRTFDGIDGEIYNEFQQLIRRKSDECFRRGRTPLSVPDDWDEEE
ncbi:MAG: hypothetical protein E7218_04440 [Anaerofustis stercorihominis]|nr:hypothetical protein [Anaerofustis stercorihominis]